MVNGGSSLTSLGGVCPTITKPKLGKLFGRGLMGLSYRWEYFKCVSKASKHRRLLRSCFIRILPQAADCHRLPLTIFPNWCHLQLESRHVSSKSLVARFADSSDFRKNHWKSPFRRLKLTESPLYEGPVLEIIPPITTPLPRNATM